MVRTPTDSERAEREAGRMFRAAAAGWVQDLLGLRARGLDRPRRRRARRLLATPASWTGVGMRAA